MRKTKCKFFYIVVNAKKFPLHNLFYTIHKYTKKVQLFLNISKRRMNFTHSKNCQEAPLGSFLTVSHSV
jgi:hypothetical protein